MTERRTPDDATAWLRRPGASDDKYRRGVLGVRAGAPEYPGAAVLSVSAAWRTGVGLLRYVPPASTGTAPFGLPSSAAAVLAAHPETVFGDSDSRPCDAWVIGSGTDPARRTPAETGALRVLLRADAPVVVDAGALGLAAELGAGPGAELGSGAGTGLGAGPASEVPRAPAILTPHAGEFARLWRLAGLGEPDPALREPTAEAARAAAATRLADALGVAVLLKGSVSVCAVPGGPALVAGPATPWLATAGTGDVLAGIVGALVAGQHAAVRRQPGLLAELGIAATLLHDRAARLAAGVSAAGAASGRPITALDVANSIPAAFASLAAR